MQLEDSTFLLVMDKLISTISMGGKKRPESALCAKLKSAIDYRKRLNEQSSFVYIFGSDGMDETNITMLDLEQIIKELEG